MSASIIGAIVGAILLPPAALDYEPARVMVREYPLAQVAIECGIDYAAACSHPMDGLCIVILPIIGPGGVSIRDRDLLRRHEYGHCNQKHPSHEGYR